MPVIYQSIILRKDLRTNPQVLYLFGDNEQRKGYGGQAKEMRGENNARGIRTKSAPGYNHEDHWYDKDFDQKRFLINEDIYHILSQKSLGRIFIIPSDGIGTGRAMMKIKCPKLFDYLQRKLELLY